MSSPKSNGDIWGGASKSKNNNFANCKRATTNHLESLKYFGPYNAIGLSLDSGEMGVLFFTLPTS